MKLWNRDILIAVNTVLGLSMSLFGGMALAATFSPESSVNSTIALCVMCSGIALSMMAMHLSKKNVDEMQGVFITRKRWRN
ncbi:MAG: hypothetical protein JKY54_10490 [Flavobacteriales bacterium]|nr:hypothetical protein [Flavobacteriales bacterium]